MKKIIFYSNVHLGDIHLGRSYVKWFVDNFDAKFYYSHNYSKNVLSDIDNLEFNDNYWKSLPRDGDLIEIDGVIFLNTWIGSGGLALGVNFNAIHTLFTKYFKFLISKNICCKQQNLPVLTPKINFKHNSLDIKNIDEWFKNRENKKKILLCNNAPQSGQSVNHSLNSFVFNLSKRYPRHEIYLTNKEDPLLNNENIYYVESIINKKDPFNLNEISYFSTYCDIIIGRGSGPFSFCEIEENLNKTWISLTFEHLHQDSFNGLNKFPNNGVYIHSLNENIFLKAIDEK